MLTVVFAVYALALLVTLLLCGGLSDALGRKPVIAMSLILWARRCPWLPCCSHPLAAPRISTARARPGRAGRARRIRYLHRAECRTTTTTQ
jgi:MFS family permease